MDGFIYIWIGVKLTRMCFKMFSSERVKNIFQKIEKHGTFLLLLSNNVNSNRTLLMLSSMVWL